MSDELKPCPHCGGEAEASRDDEWWCIVGCKSCSAMIEEKVAGAHARPVAIQRAIAAWNRRALPNREALMNLLLPSEVSERGIGCTADAILALLGSEQ